MSQMNKMEEEVVYLSAVIELLKSMVNYELMAVVGEGDDKSVQFKTMTHQQFFFIALVDFLSQTDKKAPVPPVPYLRALRAIGNAPNFTVNDSVFDLRNAVAAFADWLHVEIAVDLWLPSLDLQVEVHIPRHLLLKIVGTLSKHNSLRSVGVAEELQRLLQKAGKTVELYQAMLVQEEIFEIFHDDVCAYHASTIVEFLNGLSWGIQNYLKPEYSRSFTPASDGSARYRFQYPKQLENSYAKSCYWNLMNHVRSGPIFAPFTVTKHLKGRY
ncbi:hypothetical protein [Pseudomonas chlororaphis]|uniref:hypothetical protein n=1 Tax=Pseudomonas chlororaphis TaxID=587753 RepID=UPI0039E062B0